MREEGRRSGSGDLEVTARRFGEWRAARQRGARIPEALWSDAVRLARSHGVAPTAGALRLDYYSLKARLDRFIAGGDEPAGDHLRFVELPIAPAAPAAECVVEYADGRGGELRIELRGEGRRELGPLARLLLGKRRPCSR